MIVKVKKLNPNAILPTRGSDKAAGYDLYACLEKNKWVEPGHTELIPTGLSMELPEGYYGAIHARSGLATKQGLRPANCVGVVDEDYRGEVMVALHNDSGKLCIIEPGQRIAQMVLLPYLVVDFEEEELSETERGEGGFGHTGK